MTNTNTEIYILHFIFDYDNKDIVNSHNMIRHEKRRTQKSLLSMKKMSILINLFTGMFASTVLSLLCNRRI